MMAYEDGDPKDSLQPNTLLPRKTCSMARAVELIGDRWTLLIIREALYGVTRFDAMQADLGAPRSVLSGRLRLLCDSGVMTKRPYKKPGQRLRHQYVLTLKGVELALPLIALMQWGDKHLRAGTPPAQIVTRKSGSPCRVGLINDMGVAVDIGETKFRVTP